MYNHVSLKKQNELGKPLHISIIFPTCIQFSEINLIHIDIPSWPQISQELA